MATSSHCDRSRARKRGAVVDLVRTPAAASRSGCIRREASAARVEAASSPSSMRVANRCPGLEATTRAGRNLPLDSTVTACAKVPRSACQNVRKCAGAQVRGTLP